MTTCVRLDVVHLNNKTSAVAEMGNHLATIDMGWKLGAVPLLGRSWAPSNTASHGPRPTFLLSDILIYPAVWPQ